MLAITEAAGARLINRDRMWHYTEGLRNWNPIWPNHGIRILPGPSSLWLDATGKRLPPPLYPGFDTLGTLEYIAKSGHEHTWFVLNQAIIKREFALSGSEQNPDLTGKDWRQTLGRAFSKTATGPVEAFKKHGADFVIKDNLADLVAGMNALDGRSAPGLRHGRARGHRPRPAARESLRQRLAARRDSPGTQVCGRQADPRGQAPPRYSTPRPGR